MISVQKFCFNAFGENMYLLYDETKECVVIDPGCYEKHEKDELSDFIATKSLKVVMLINTHCHIDHVLGNFYVKEKYKVQLGIHPKEEVILRAIPTVAQNYGFPLYAHTDYDFLLKDKIQFGNSELSVLFVPGHAPGHVVFYHEGQSFCIGGDVLFRASIGRTDLPYGDHDTLINAIRTVMFALPDDTIIYPGHGSETTIGYEKENNPFLQL